MADTELGRQLRSLERHVSGVVRAAQARIDALLKSEIDDGERGELDFLCQTLKPPAEAALEDITRIAKRVATLTDAG